MIDEAGASGGRRLARPTAKAAAERVLAALPLRPPVARRVALCYHSVAAAGTPASTATDRFRDHVRWLAERCRLVRFEELLTTDGGDPRPTVAITFDDGYEDNWREALPILVEYGITATFFITCGLIDGDRDVLRRLQQAWGSAGGALRPLSVHQLRELEAAGMSFGAHTKTHPNLRLAPEQDVRAEIVGSRDWLEDLLGQPIRSFAYPFGDARFHLSATTVALARSCGVEQAGTVEYRSVTPATDPLLVPRFPVGDEPLEVVRAKVLGRLDVVGAWRERMPGWLTRPLSSGGRRGVTEGRSREVAAGPEGA